MHILRVALYEAQYLLQVIWRLAAGLSDVHRSLHTIEFLSQLQFLILLFLHPGKQNANCYILCTHNSLEVWV